MFVRVAFKSVAFKSDDLLPLWFCRFSGGFFCGSHLSSLLWLHVPGGHTGLECSRRLHAHIWQQMLARGWDSLVLLRVPPHPPLTFLHGGLREAVPESGNRNSVTSAVSCWSKQRTRPAQVQGWEHGEPLRGRAAKSPASGLPADGCSHSLCKPSVTAVKKLLFWLVNAD